MKCLLCGLEFRQGKEVSGCRGCPLARSCGLVRCPNCGYEVPLEPKLLRVFKKWRKKVNETKR